MYSLSRGGFLTSSRDHELHQFVPHVWIEGLGAEYVVRKGNPAEEIMAAARDLDIDMIIMGSRGHSALATVFVGSVTQNVVNHVLVVHPTEHDFVE